MKVPWDEIRAEYISDHTVSFGDLERKYGVSHQAISKRAKKEGWQEYRKKVIADASKRVAEKAAKVNAENAEIAARIKQKLLKHLEKEVDNLPEGTGTEMRANIQDRIYNDDNGRLMRIKETSKSYRVRELIGSLAELSKGIQADEEKTEVADDGFLAALNGTAADDWNEE